MSNKAALNFALLFQADGASNSLAININTAPIGVSPPGSSPSLSGTFNATASTITNLSGDASTGAVTLGSFLLGIATFNFANVPSAGFHTITGTLIF